MKRRASAVWEGDLKTGKGSISTESGILSSAQCSFTNRFENGIGTSPEELIAAAHEGCFSMVLTAQLAQTGMKSEKIEAFATVTLDKLEKGCPVSRLLNAKITMNASLVK